MLPRGRHWKPPQLARNSKHRNGWYVAINPDLVCRSQSLLHKRSFMGWRVGSGVHLRVQNADISRAQHSGDVFAGQERLELLSNRNKTSSPACAGVAIVDICRSATSRFFCEIRCDSIAKLPQKM
jgi:hypothetical protein